MVKLRKIEPWPVMKVTFVLSFLVHAVMFALVALVWFGVHSYLMFAVDEYMKSFGNVTVSDYITTGRVLGGCAVLGAAGTIVTTVLATVGAFLYNCATFLVGNVEFSATRD